LAIAFPVRVSERDSRFMGGKIEFIQRIYIVESGLGPFDQAFELGPFYIQADHAGLRSQSLLRYIS